jgi:tRNA1Val (adenine37-N6)-methyltransferase
MSRTDELWPGGYRLTFDNRAFLPGTDAFLLGAFARPARGEYICDLGAGGGILGLLLLARQPACRVTGIEIQQSACALAEENIADNALSDRLSVRCGDLRQSRALFRPGTFDRVITNPPYFKQGSGATAATVARQTAREETGCTIDDICAAASDLLRWGGTFDVVFRPERLSELFCAMERTRLEPKRLRWVQERAGRAPLLVLAEGKKGAHPGLVTQPPLLLHEADGTDTRSLAEIYFRNREA